MRMASSLKWFAVLVVYFVIAGCSEESSQNEPTLSGDSGTQDGSDTENDSATLSCGDGRVEGSEECDDGEANSDELADACRTNCKIASCGDGVIDIRLNETCDDGNTIDDDACNNLCRSSSCGDGVLQPNEACDDGPDNSDTRPNACRTNCTEARCGDSATDSGEACDDGNNISIDDCIDCVAARCGDGIIRQNVERCDDANASSLDGCSDICQVEPGFDCPGQPSVCATICGDGVKSGLEACDDRNTDANDYCSADCSQITGSCGDNIVQGNESCDDGNAFPDDGCAPNCTFSGSCGDNIRQPTETCDDGNQQDGDYCSANCSEVTGSCGDGNKQNNEQCDDGNQIVGDYCSNGCIATGFCGDGVIQFPANETCDDRNSLNNDGCSDLCLPEPGWACAAGMPTVCSAILCAEDQRVQNHACVNCPPGTTNAAEDNASSVDTFCDPTLCSANYHVQNHECTACPAGTTNAAGDDASNSDTACDVTLCAINQYVANNTCTPCSPGTTSAAGDDASGANTTCDIVFCAANQRVQNNACVACAPGTSNAAGDNATGSNTTCDTVFCAVSQRVQNNACVACPSGMGNAAGDDASGPNTTCETDPCSAVLGVLCADFAEAYIKASNTGANDQFGFSIALSGDTLAVGAPEEDSNATGINGNQADNSLNRSGAVYVFTRAGTTWTQQAYIKASNTDSSDFFGASVALSGDTLAVGAYAEASHATGINGNQSDNTGSGLGAVYVFTRSSTVWTQQAYIKASNTGPGDLFGTSVALSGNTLAVGAIGESSNATGINGNQADNSASRSGAVYVFTRSGITWTQQAYIKASNTNAEDFFGSSLAVSGDTLAVGAYYEGSNATGINGNQADNSAFQSGAAYVFTRSGTTWSQQAYIKASNTNASDRFGSSIALDGNTLAIGAYFEGSNATGINGNQANNSAIASGAVYIFTRSGTTWTQQAYIKASNAQQLDNFGSSVALSGDTLTVGAPQEDSNATGVNGNQTDNSASDSGSVYVFTRTGTTWTQQAYIKASNTDTNDRFGSSIALSGTTLAVGALLEESNATGINGDQANNSADNSGAVYIRKIAP